MNWIWKSVITILAIPFVFIATIILLVNTPSISLDSGVKAADIRKLKIGMNRHEVITILGKPSELYPSDESITDKDGTRTLLHPDRITYRFNRYTPWGTIASKLYVHMDNNAISDIYGKRYDIIGIDDYGVYFINSDGENWESKEFSKAFP